MTIKSNNTATTTKNIFMLFEGSYQIMRKETELNINETYAQYHLAKQTEYRESNKGYWAAIIMGNTERRFKINELNEFICTKEFTF
jgi:hypothetical protein